MVASFQNLLLLFSFPLRLSNGLQWNNRLSESRFSSRLARRTLFCQNQKTLAPGSHQTETEVKKSRFIAYASHASSWKEAQDYIHMVKDDHPKGRHWCYAYSGGLNPVTERCSDDGEPTGTAGQPILNAINGESLSNTVCVVVRYFGGIKLGAGGLIRAYGGAARQTLREAPVEVLIPTDSFQIQVEISLAGAIYDAIAKHRGTASSEAYSNDGKVSVVVTCDSSVAPVLRESLKDATRGRVEFVH